MYAFTVTMLLVDLDMLFNIVAIMAEEVYLYILNCYMYFQSNSSYACSIYRQCRCIWYFKNHWNKNFERLCWLANVILSTNTNICWPKCITILILINLATKINPCRLALQVLHKFPKTSCMYQSLLIMFENSWHRHTINPCSTDQQ